jgi:hypothetical protein
MVRLLYFNACVEAIKFCISFTDKREQEKHFPVRKSLHEGEFVREKPTLNLCNHDAKMKFFPNIARAQKTRTQITCLLFFVGYTQDYPIYPHMGIKSPFSKNIRIW